MYNSGSCAYEKNGRLKKYYFYNIQIWYFWRMIKINVSNLQARKKMQHGVMDYVLICKKGNKLGDVFLGEKVERRDKTWRNMEDEPRSV